MSYTEPFNGNQSYYGQTGRLDCVSRISWRAVGRINVGGLDVDNIQPWVLDRQQLILTVARIRRDFF